MKNLWLAACAVTVVGIATPLNAQLADPTNPDAQVPSVRYKPVLHDYRFSPQPALGNWKELNDRAEKIGGPLGQLREPNQPYRKRRRR